MLHLKVGRFLLRTCVKGYRSCGNWMRDTRYFSVKETYYKTCASCTAISWGVFWVWKVEPHQLEFQELTFWLVLPIYMKILSESSEKWNLLHFSYNSFNMSMDKVKTSNFLLRTFLPWPVANFTCFFFR